MKIKIVTGATAFEAAKNVLEYVDFKDFDKENLIVVPDSFSMQAESLVFDVLKQKATFNTEIVGISRLASKLLKRNNVQFERVSGIEEIFCIFKAIKEQETNFKYFKKCGVDLCIQILQIVKQFKACKILPSHIKSVGDELLDNKMSDLKNIYERYEQLLESKFDLSRLLQFFVENLEEKVNLSKTNLYFVNFDSFSTEINSFVCQLAKYVNQIYIGYAKPISQNNAFIYEDDIFQKTKKFAADNGVVVEVVNPKSGLSGNKLKIVKNLFGFDIENGQDDFFKCLIAKNKKDEVEFVAKYIRYQIFSGEKFKNFAIAVSDKSYYEEIKTIFAQYDIAFYCDDATDLSQTILGKFLLKIINISKIGFTQENLQFLANSLILNENSQEEILSQIRHYNVQDEVEFVERNPDYKDIVEDIKNLLQCKEISNYCEKLQEILKKNKKNYDLLSNKLKKCNNFQKESENVQAFELVERVLDKLSLLGKDEVFELSDFEKLLTVSLQAVKVETIPTYIDAVFVGDATSSYFSDVNTLCVLGATANALPKNRSDIGIIDDEDIKKLSLNIKIEPEIKVLNRRNRLKVFELFQHANSNLIVSYPLQDGGQLMQKSSIIEDLQKMFGKNVVHSMTIEDCDDESMSEEELLKRLLFFVGGSKNLLQSYTYLQGKNKIAQKFSDALKVLVNNSVPKRETLTNFSIGEKNQSLFEVSKVSASQLETYFKCPFMHFVKYVLGVKELQNIEPTKMQFGSFQHLLLEHYFSTEDRERLDIDGFVDEFVSKYANRFYDKKILDRKYFVNYLRNESKIILKNAKNEQKISDFRPFLLEKSVFGPYFSNSNLSGIVDRVDKSDNYFRIIDYKTGETDNVRKDLFYGKKLQLFLYAGAIKQKTGLDCAGVFYFDCQTKYGKQDEAKKHLNGLITKDEKAILKTDYRLEEIGFKSDVLGVQHNKPTQEKPFGYRGSCLTEKLEDLIDYAKEVSEVAVDEIKSGYIEAKPLDGMCKWCPYMAVCQHRESGVVRKMQSVDDENLKRKK
ncbi:MAG: PD-(D/E)XK nuclease family protein [Clostridia bacterium]|nr:PD-(D/E)XK nuclease family protein [Clostridia bacterium]